MGGTVPSTNDNVSLNDTTPEQAPPAAAYDGAQHTAAVSARQLTIDEVLNSARLPEKRAEICLRADLQAQYDVLAAELATLVTADGEVIVDDEAAAGEVTAAARARELDDNLASIRAEMEDSMWRPLFRGLSSEDLAVFNKEHRPADPTADMTDYNTRLIAATMTEPTATVDEVQALRRTLGSLAMIKLVRTASEVCVQGGVDVPKSSRLSLRPQEQ
ncbi:hypothetical protein QWY28_13225 [Nocardioides sp. SOB77]|uniref:DUF222 domain-containing protein n=1 Tax=Nocardioides oceani TaxID=3058369 RepID=A0ABT8FGU9_9ACTN|nr:hypothetical protein [Nocardioides oceani]MDN4173916.1 hypothetical protein [Nocardioides oceani]